MRVFGAYRFVPAAIIAKKILESAFCGIEGMLQKRKIQANGIGERRVCASRSSIISRGRHERFWQKLRSQLFQLHGQDESAGVVVGGVAFFAIRNRKN